MKSIYATKKLQNTALYKELQRSLKNHFELSLNKEQKQKSYLSRIDVCNISTGEIFKLDYNFDTEYKKNIKLLEQKVSAIECIAKELGYVSVFMTFTAPSYFHPFTSVKRKDNRLYVGINENFSFTSIDSAVKDSYLFLNSLVRTFYKRVKNYVGDEYLYIKVFEPHATTIPHVHYLVFFPYEYIDAVRGVYQRVIEYYKLNQATFEECSFRENITYASRYLLKYITKNIADSQDYFTIRSLDGWKRHHKIRVLTSSDIGLSQFIYKKVYYALTSDIKAQIDAIIKEQNIPYYLYIKNNTFIKKEVKQLDLKRVKTIRSTVGNQASLFKVELKINRIRSPDTKKVNYKITEMMIRYKQEVIYKKSNLIRILNA